MKNRIHAIAGVLAFLLILSFWLSTVVSELVGSSADVAMVKQGIMTGMVVLIPALIVTAGSGFSLARGRQGRLVNRKRVRMPFIALNGLLVLVPSAIFLAQKSASGGWDGWFYGIQALELVAGAVNLTLIGLNIRDGMRMSGRLRRRTGQQAA